MERSGEEQRDRTDDSLYPGTDAGFLERKLISPRISFRKRIMTRCKEVLFFYLIIVIIFDER